MVEAHPPALTVETLAALLGSVCAASDQKFKNSEISQV